MRRLLLLVATLVLVSTPILAQDEGEVERSVDVDLMDEGCPAGDGRFCIQPATLVLEEGHTLVLDVENTGRVAHNLTFEPGTPGLLAMHGMNTTLSPGNSTQIRIPFSDVQEALEQTGEARFELVCGLDGHAELGERLTVRVPSMADEEENPQPGFGAVAAVAVIGAVALVLARRRR